MARMALLFLVFIAGCMEDVNEMEKQARDFANKMGINVKAVSCMDRDSDGDSYVSCTVSQTDGPPIAIECKSRWALGSGCILQRNYSRRRY